MKPMEAFHTYGGLVAYRMSQGEREDAHQVRCTRCSQTFQAIEKDGIGADDMPVPRAEFYVPALDEALCEHCFRPVNLGMYHWMLNDKQRAVNEMAEAKMNGENSSDSA